MISKGLHAPNKIVHGKCDPAKRLIVARVESGKHPAQLAPPESPVVRVFHQEVKVVPAHKLIAQHGEENHKRYDGNRERQPTVQLFVWLAWSLRSGLRLVRRSH